MQFEELFVSDVDEEENDYSYYDPSLVAGAGAATARPLNVQQHPERPPVQSPPPLQPLAHRTAVDVDSGTPTPRPRGEGRQAAVPITVWMPWLACDGCVSLQCIANVTFADLPRVNADSAANPYTLWYAAHMAVLDPRRRSCPKCPPNTPMTAAAKKNESGHWRPGLRCKAAHFVAVGRGGHHDARQVLWAVVTLCTGLRFGDCHGHQFGITEGMLRSLWYELASLASARNFLCFVRDEDNWGRDDLTVVQADETAFGARKYQRGKRVRRNGILWVAGACEVSEGHARRFVARVVASRSHAELAPQLEHLLAPGATLHRDGLRSYDGVGQNIGVANRVVVHQREFVAADGTHTNHIEAMWGSMKGEMRRRWCRPGGARVALVSRRVQFIVWLLNTRMAGLPAVSCLMQLWVEGDFYRSALARRPLDVLNPRAQGTLDIDALTGAPDPDIAEIGHSDSDGEDGNPRPLRAAAAAAQPASARASEATPPDQRTTTPPQPGTPRAARENLRELLLELLPQLLPLRRDRDEAVPLQPVAQQPPVAPQPAPKVTPKPGAKKGGRPPKGKAARGSD